MAEASAATKALKARLDHPIVDADAHQLEVLPVLFDFIREVGGPEMPERCIALHDAPAPHVRDDARRAHRRPRTSCRCGGRCPPRTRSTARTTVLPRLLYERLDEIGLDFTIVYPGRACRSSRCRAWPTTSCGARRARAFNLYNAEMFGPYARSHDARPAVIPMHTPEEAIEELEYASGELGLKAVRVRGRRAAPGAAVRARASRPRATRCSTRTASASTARTTTTRCGQTCIELGVAPTFHSGPIGWGTPRVGHAPPVQPDRRLRRGRRGARQVAVLRRRHAALPRRCTSASSRAASRWGQSLYCRMLDHWKKRNGEAIVHLDPRARHDAVRRAHRRVRAPEGEGDPRPARAGLAVVRLTPTSSTTGARAASRSEEDFAAAVRAALLLRLRGRRPHGRRSPSTRELNPFGVRLQRDARLRHRPLRRDRHARGARRGARDSSTKA